MILYILRHGPAENEPPPGGDDGARRLTARGREKVREAAAGMRALGLKFDAILASPLPRAAETAELVATVYSTGPAPEPSRRCPPACPPRTCSRHSSPMNATTI